MKIEECKIGMEVKCTTGMYYGGVDKGKVYKIKNIKNEPIKLLGFEGINGGYPAYLPEFFESVNKFEVGDEVIYNCSNGIKYDSVIFGIKDRQYAIKYTHKTIEHYDVVIERQLSPLKKKDELEVGDKFIRTGTKYEVLAVAYEEFRDSIIYFAKMLNGNLEGRIVDFNSEFIDEIIYD